MKDRICRWALLGAVACGGTANDTATEDTGGSGAGASSGKGAGESSGGQAGGGASGAAGADSQKAGSPKKVPVIAAPVAKVDLLMMVDNSISMSDKQGILQLAVPDIVNRLVNPICVDALGNEYPAAPAGQPCPEGQARQFAAMTDINVGIVSSSLGDAGANVACPSAQVSSRYLADRADMAHLAGSLARSTVETDTAEGFLTWRPGSTDLDAFEADVQQMVRDVGENGCGWESSLESWYRFLVEPAPYRELERVPCPNSGSTQSNCVQPAADENGDLLLDEVLLAQRAAFLRPDSLVVVLMLTDENDCSLRAGGQTWVVAAIDDARPMFRGSSACASDPNAKCCYSCPLGPPEGCAGDPICNVEDLETNTFVNRLPAEQDGQNLRCFDQKRRFGLDFLYPTQRYVNALSELELCATAPDLSIEGCEPKDIVKNPLYETWDRRQRVFLAGIIGVPWQAIASSNDENGQPLSDPSTQLRFKSSAEMGLPGDETWDQILGSPGVAWRAADPETGRPEVMGVPAVPPLMPQMIESELPRAGITPGNLINGRDYDTASEAVSPGTPDDLQYACIFRLPTPRDCASRDPNAGEACDCYPEFFDSPLCEEEPGVSEPTTTQHFAKAYPGARHLAVLKGYGANSIVASICARNVTDPSRSDFGYRPAAQAVLERLNAAISASR